MCIRDRNFTTGWSVVSEKAIKLSKEEARKWLQQMMNEGVSPEDLRAIPD